MSSVEVDLRWLRHQRRTALSANQLQIRDRGHEFVMEIARETAMREIREQLERAEAERQLTPGWNMEFPTVSLTPKRETGVTSFLQKFGEMYDGRGVVIAILDSGVDPAVDGLQVTTTGAPKVIERYDCSGAGDVDTKTILTPNGDGAVTGFDGTIFKIPANWENPSGEFHYGVKPLYDLYTSKVRETAEAKRKEEYWDKPMRVAAGEALKNSPINTNGNNPPPTDKLDRDETEAPLEAIDLLEKKYKDWGPLIHCFLFRDKSNDWKVALALSADLTQVKLLREYSKDQSHKDLSKEDRVTVSVNVWEDGDRLEVVAMCSGHGTHVAAIAAGNFPDNPDLNGVAPGAQIISLSIGDNRLGSMETMQAVSRACCFLQKNASRIQLLNMSYGEHSHFPNGRIGELIRDTIDKYGIIWCGSAGNHGPALSTVGSPPWICADNVIGIGAYVSPDMMTAEYALRERLEAGMYTWSSRGPTIDGDIGVNVCAPGGAITSVPHFTQRCSQLMNGTSMASPHCAGVIALLISAAKDRDFSYSPYSMKQALVNAAAPVESSDAFSVGGGIIQVERTLEKLELLSKAPERDVRFQVTVGAQKGIYIRDVRQAQKEYSVTVEPIFFKDSTIDVQAKIDFRLNLVLVSSAYWVFPPSFLDIANMSRSFSIKVELEGLPVGVHYAKVEAFDVKDVSRGAVFRVHVTAVVPIPLQERNAVELPLVNYEPNMIKRNFFCVPRGANSVALNLKSNGTTPCRLNIHAVTLIQGQCCKTEEFNKVLTLAAGEEITLNFKAFEEKVMEICIARWWAEAKEMVPIQTKVTFKSLIADVTEIHASACDVYSRVNVSSAFQTEEVQPTACLKNQVCLLRASSYKLQSLSEERNAFPESKVMFELISQYPITIARATTITINCVLLSENLYEGEYESQLWMLFDSSKRMVGVGDAYPSHYPIKLEKGEYTLRLHVRHEKRDFLEKLVSGYPNFQGEPLSPGLPVVLSAKLQANITLNIHQSIADLQAGRKGSGWSGNVKKSTSTPLFISTSITEKNLKNLPCGQSTHYFTGTLVIQKDEKRGIPLRVFMPESAPKMKSSPEKAKEEILDQMRDVKVSWMSKVEKEDSLRLYNELVASNPTCLGIYSTRIGVLETQLKETIEAEAIGIIHAEIKELIGLILNQVDRNTLLAYFASKAPDAKLKTQMEKAKAAFVEAHVKRGCLFPEDAAESWAEATSFYDPADSKVIELTIQDAIGRKHWGRAMKYLLKAEDSFPDKDKKMAEVAEKLGWDGTLWWLNEVSRYKAAMKDYRLF